MLKIEYLNRKEDVYDIKVEKNQNFYANDVLVHNCAEICLPTSPILDINGVDGEIALCTLAAINLGKFDPNNLQEMEKDCYLLVRALDNLLTFQSYPVKVAENWAKKRRSLGIGVINYAYFLAKNNTKYSDGSANGLTHKTFEALQYYLLKASMSLAKERGQCEAFEDTNYAQGILPIDTYKKDVDDFCQQELLLDWEWLRKEIQENGLRNSTLSAQMPAETSAQISNATNGIEPPRGLVSIKASKDGILKQVVPEVENLKDKYELLWDMPDNNGYLQLVAIMQKFIDQSISTNTNYDPKKFPDDKIPMKVLLRDLLLAYKYGIKTLYYQNTRDGASDKQTNIDNPQEEKLEEVHASEEDCDSCKI